MQWLANYFITWFKKRNESLLAMRSEKQRFCSVFLHRTQSKYGNIWQNFLNVASFKLVCCGYIKWMTKKYHAKATSKKKMALVVKCSLHKQIQTAKAQTRKLHVTKETNIKSPHLREKVREIYIPAQDQIPLPLKAHLFKKKKRFRQWMNQTQKVTKCTLFLRFFLLLCLLKKPLLQDTVHRIITHNIVKQHKHPRNYINRSSSYVLRLPPLHRHPTKLLITILPWLCR